MMTTFIHGRMNTYKRACTLAFELQHIQFALDLVSHHIFTAMQFKLIALLAAFAATVSTANAAVIEERAVRHIHLPS